MIQQLISTDEMYDNIANEMTNIIKKGHIYVIKKHESTPKSPLIWALAGTTFLSVIVGAGVAHAKSADSHEFSIGGDLTLSGRLLEGAPNNADKESIGGIARLNLGYSLNDFLKLGVRPVAEFQSAPAFDHRFIEDHHELHVDRAFANLKINEKLNATFGAFSNEYTGWMDRDIPIIGSQIDYSQKDILSLDKLAAKFAYHIGQPWLDEANSGLWVVEFEGQKKLGDNYSLIASVNYMDWYELDNEFIRTNRKSGSDYASDFKVINAGIRLIDNTDVAPIVGGTVELYAKAMHNFGADEENNGIIGGVKFGHLKEPGDAYFKVEGRYIERDATLASLAPKYTSNTGFNQLVLAGGYRIDENTTANICLGLPRNIHEAQGRKTYIQFDLNLKF
jgi:hypothetical protein